MKTTYKNFFLFSLLLLFSASNFTIGNLPTASPESVGVSSQRLQRLDQQMHQYVDNGQLANIQTAVMRKGKLIHFDTYGYADLENKKPLEDNSIFRIYSMTKPIVSVGLMMLYEEGKFLLHDPIEKYIPEMKDMKVHVGNGKTEPAKNKIRVIDVLRHTTGFGYGWGSNTYVDSLYRDRRIWMSGDNKGFIENLAKIPLYHEPGTGWRYSVSTDVAGYLVEVLSGQPLDQFLSERILEPLQMKDTHFEVPDSKDDRFIANYSPTKEGKLKVIDHPSTSRYTKEVTMLSGGGGMVSTSMDYLRFCQMLLNGGQLDGKRILSPKTIELMTKSHTKDTPHIGGPVTMGRGNGFGLGFAVTTDLADSAMLGSEGVYGWSGAAGTYFRIDPKEELIYLMMIQIMPNNHLQAREKFQNLVYQSIVQ